MVELTGNLGKVTVGRNPAVDFYAWRLVRADETLGDRVNRITGTVGSINQFWVTQFPTRVALWMGSCWWVWAGPSMTFPHSIDVGQPVLITISGNPTID